MTTENITISKDYLLKAYRAAGPALKEFMKQLFGPDTFAISFNVMDRVKTFQDAVDELGNDNPLVRQYNQIYSELGNLMGTDIIAYLKLRIITAALNEGWEPQHTMDERRFFPCFTLLTKEGYDMLNDADKKKCVSANGAIIYAFAGCYSAVYNAADGACFAYKTRELAKYAGKQFLNIWADFVFKGGDHTNQHE